VAPRPVDRTPSGTRELDAGFALVGTLIVVVILAILATIVVTSLSGKSPSSPGNTIPGAGGTTIPTNAANGAQLAAVSSCQADFASVTSAVTTYRTLNGSNPPAGTQWATSTANNGPFMSPWPSDPGYFTLTWNGSEISVIPAHGTASHGSPGSSTPKTGCYAA
jgi:hypothetical protein